MPMKVEHGCHLRRPSSFWSPARSTYLATIIIVLTFVVGIDARMRTVMVGRRGDELALKFTPEAVFAEVGDQVQFQFYPLNHSVVEAAFEQPCVPAGNGTAKLGFFSGFHPLPRDTKVLDTFTVNVTTKAPVFFYCSQGRHCQSGFVGAINPSGAQTLNAFRAAAARAPDNLSPGEEPVSSRPTVPEFFQGNGTNNTDFNGNGNSSSVPNIGAIVGGVLGGVVFIICGISGVVFVIMRRRREAGQQKPKRRKRIRTKDVGFPVLQRDSAGVYASERA